ncbi:integrase [Enterococcus sp. PF1-24]|uniref:site-specific integrase n=1 Tax=unclassified Enterococcus TaxID=2608891 RepID=UPI002473B020|nr:MULTISPECIES: site-specific integrase [unclassified Enterococcus]MDH6364711.1 integrase [Enterococcus sp. PFB1-1]MDH6401813.1 integrase [Enterococcus sp. PF1-24]
MATFKQYEKKDGTKAWQFKAYLGTNPINGKEIRTTRRGFQTKKEAQLALSRLQVGFENEGLKKETKDTFQQVYELWLEIYKTTVKEVTLIKTEIKFTKWILPVYGDLRIKEVTVQRAQQIVNTWAKETDQYKVLHSTAKRIFEYAINLGLIQYNPLAHIMMPNRNKTIISKKVIKVYSKEEVKTLIDYVNAKFPSYKNDFNKTLLRFLFYSGCRVSEALALSWSDIDFDNNLVLFDKTLTQTKNGYEISEPKTDSSKDTVTLDDKTLAILKHWQINQRKYMLSVGITDPTMIFCGIYKELVTHHAIYIRIKTMAEKTNLPFLGVHVTRHTHASLLLDAGATMKEVQERLRHASISMTMDTYGHLSKETKEKTVEKLVKHLNF